MHSGRTKAELEESVIKQSWDDMAEAEPKQIISGNNTSIFFCIISR
jgi:hypothetical protein